MSGAWVLEQVKSRRAICLFVAVIAGLLTGCAGVPTKVQQKTAKLGDWSDSGRPPMVLAADPNAAATAFNASEKDLSEVDWSILERYAPRSTWDRIRARNKEIIKVRALARQLQAAPMKPKGKKLKLPEVDVEKLANGQIQMYYQVRNFGGVNVLSKGSGSVLDRRVVSVQKSSLATLVELVKHRLGDKGSVRAIDEHCKLIITCQPAAKQKVLELLARVDVPLPQVSISARIFEVSHNMDFQAGVKLMLTHIGSTGNQQGFGTVLSAERFLGQVTDPLPGGTMADPSAAMRVLDTFGNSGWSLDATMQAMEETGLVKMISRPSMTVTAGKTAHFMAGEERPVASARYTDNNLVTEKTTYKPVGVQLTVTPEIVGPDTVKLHVITIVSLVSGFQQMSGMTGVTSPVLNPIIDVREAETFVTVKDGDALVIGGLRQNRTIVAESRVPLLGDIPVLGWLFKTHRSQELTTDLYLFVTPRIIHPVD
ncbi:MAG: hypothetical protein J7M14_05025 [Planctomycetes bacterium]|nr:hypothetical protein [Planctomycetota bacterium]